MIHPVGHLQLQLHISTTMVSNEVARLTKFASRLTKNWGSTLAVYGAAAAVIGLYFTDWKVTNKNIPFYGKKFDDEGNL